jgi:hypothetical protein
MIVFVAGVVASLVGYRVGELVDDERERQGKKDLGLNVGFAFGAMFLTWFLVSRAYPAWA